MGKEIKQQPVGDDAVAKLKLELYEAIETKMNASLERDRQFIQSTIGAASKLGGYALSVVALAITLFGIKTCSDVKTTVDATTKSEVDSLIKTANPVAAYEKDTRRYFESAMVNSYRIQIAAPRRQFEPFSPLPSDVQRMREILHNPETDDNLFSQVIDILVSISARDDRSALGADLAGLFAGKISSLDWIKNSLTKRIEIIDALGRLGYSDARPAILPLIDSEETEPKLRIAAIKYSVRLSAGNAIPHLKKIADDHDPQIKMTALQGIIVLDPGGNEIKEYLHTIANDSAISAEGLTNALEIFSLLDESRSTDRFLQSDEDKARNDQIATLISEILDICADRGISVSLSLRDFSPTNNEQTKLDVRNPSGLGIYYSTEPTALLWNNGAGLNKFLRSAMANPDISVMAKKFRVFGNLRQEKDLFVSEFYQLIAELDTEAKIDIEGGSTITGADAPFGVFFATGKAGTPTDLSATWYDGSGIKRTSHVIKFNNPEAVTFKWKKAANPLQ